MVLRFHALLLSVLIALGSSAATIAQNISDETKTTIVQETARLLEELYVFPESGIKYSEEILRKHDQGVFQNADTAEEFARKLTGELQSIQKDSHLRVLSPAMTTQRFRPTGNASREEMMQRRLEAEKEQNYFFDRVEVLPDNIGYFRLNQFPAPDPAKSRVDAIMRFLQDTDAVILDLRNNPGGAEGLNQYISSYFFKAGTDTVLYTRYYRPGDSTLVVRTLPKLPSPRMAEKDLYILVGPLTGSSAENISYSLQSIGRATIVGEATYGAAHSSRIMPLAEGFVLQIPIARVSNPYTNESWEGTGVIPDIQTDFEKAHLVAQQVILEGRISRSTDAERIDRLKQALAEVTAQLNADTNSDSQNPDEGLKEYEGQYGSERFIRIDNEGYLTYKREGGIDLRMEKIDKDYYKLRLAQSNMRAAKALPHLRFNRNEQNKVKGITLVFDDGRVAGTYEKTE